LFPLHYNP